jgi:hypothetical protein
MLSANSAHHHDAEMTRRRIFAGAASLVMLAPSIVRAATLMKVRGLILPIEHPSAGFVERLRFQFLEAALRRGWISGRDGQVVGGISETQAIDSAANSSFEISDLTKTYQCLDSQSTL